MKARQYYIYTYIYIEKNAQECIKNYIFDRKKINKLINLKNILSR